MSNDRTSVDDMTRRELAIEVMQQRQRIAELELEVKAARHSRDTYRNAWLHERDDANMLRGMLRQQEARNE